MSESVDKEAVHALAALAHLTLSADEEAQAAQDLQQILGHLDTVASMPAETPPDAPPAAVRGSERTWRADETKASLSADAALSQAPERLGDGFGVPKIVE